MLKMLKGKQRTRGKAQQVQHCGPDKALLVFVAWSRPWPLHQQRGQRGVLSLESRG